MAYYGLFSWIRMVPGSVLEDMLKDAGNCACDVWPLATHQRRSSLTSSLAEANGKHCNARLLREFQAPLLRNVWLMGYVSFLKQPRPTCVDMEIPPREKGFALNIVIMFCVACRWNELLETVMWFSSWRCSNRGACRRCSSSCSWPPAVEYCR